MAEARAGFSVELRLKAPRCDWELSNMTSGVGLALFWPMACLVAHADGWLVQNADVTPTRVLASLVVICVAAVVSSNIAAFVWVI